jgi:hypothetical protein
MRSLRMIALGGVAVLALSANAMASQSPAETRQLNTEQVPQGIDAVTPVTITPRVNLSADFGPQPALAPMALNSFSNPPDKVATARVVDAKGITIGAVQKVDITDGKPTRVEIALLGSNQVISLDAQSVSYDEASNVLMASGNDLPAPRG